MLKNIITSAKKHTKFENTMELIRVYLGIGLFFKGIHFMIHPQDLVYFLSQGQLNVIESFISHYVISAHLVGGLLLTFGLLTRLAALIQLPVLIGALGLVHSKDMLFSTNQNFEFTALVLFLLVLFSIIGSGNMSMDYHILNEDGDEKAWIEEKLKQVFSREGHLVLVRLSSKIQKKPTRLSKKKKN
mgnify:CR=1 FL=1|tara:strand:+ start:6325 stop:6885 length:561 start_codon:yes stop_codon:yes gene_type:complete